MIDNFPVAPAPRYHTQPTSLPLSSSTWPLGSSTPAPWLRFTGMRSSSHAPGSPAAAAPTGGGAPVAARASSAAREAGGTVRRKERSREGMPAVHQSGDVWGGKGC